MCQNNEQTTAVLTYDLDTRNDANINNEIKTYMIETWHWQDTVIEEYPIANTFYEGGILPETVLVKQNISKEEAIHEFRWALSRYDTQHQFDEPKRFANFTRAIVFMANDYEIIHKN